MDLTQRSYCDRILRVDLATGGLTTTPLPADAMPLVLGGKGLGAWLLYTEQAPGVDPLGPDNHLIFHNGPLTGTTAPTAGRFGCTAGSPAAGAPQGTDPRASPRARGTHTPPPPPMPEAQGLSPLARGNHGVVDRPALALGPIPARAGQPIGFFHASLSLGAYPRSRGATVVFRSSTFAAQGLSPLARGNLR